MSFPTSPILHEDDQWLVLDKPSGISTHGAHEGDLGVAEWLRLHLGRTVFVCTRLDKGTSGVLPLAKTPAASAEAERIHAGDDVLKVYRLLTDRPPPESAWTVDRPVEGAAASTRFAVERAGRGVWLVRAEITRGRRHQIRRHAQDSGMPILGDAEHGGSPFTRLCLHCAETRWPGQERPWVSPLPGCFTARLDGAPTLRVDTLAALERRGAWLKPVTNAWRVVHRGEAAALPFAVEVFDRHLSVTGFDESTPAAVLIKELAPALDEIRRATGAVGGVVRTHRRDPHRRALFADLLAFGEPPPADLTVFEHDLRYGIALNDAQHTGLFLDQRDNRRRLATRCAGARVANLFAFTCSFSAVAARNGAEVVFSVDLAAGSLDRGVRNFGLSGIPHPGRGKFICEDVRDWLARQSRKRAAEGPAFKAWDQVICDPPVFASAGKGKAFSVEKEWPALVSQIHDLLPPGGRALFANNHRGGDDRAYHAELAARFASVTRNTPPLDFPSVPHEPDSVRMYDCAKGESRSSSV